MILFPCPYIIVPLEKPAIIRASDLKGSPSWQEMQRREKALREATFPFPFVPPSSIPAASVSYVANADTAGTTASEPQDFTSVNFGAATADRQIFVFVGKRVGGGATITAVTVGSVAGTAVVSSFSNSENCAALFRAAVPTGTSGTIQVATNSGGGNICILVWAAYNLLSSTPTDTGSSIASNPTTSLDISADGIGLGGVFTNSSGTTTWSGLTEGFDGNFDNNSKTYSAASSGFATAQTGLTVTGTFTGGGSPLGAFASYR